MLTSFEMKKIVDKHANIAETAAALRGDPGAGKAPFDGDHAGAEFSQESRDRAAAAA